MPNLASSPDKFLYDKVAHLVSKMIESGTLKPGDRVPSLRKMSKKLDVSVATVMQAYTSLEHRGMVEARPQSGFYVRSNQGNESSIPKPTKPKSQPCKVKFGNLVESIMSAAREPHIVPLGMANPSAELLPVKGLTRAMNYAANNDAANGINYCFPPGDHELRRQIAFRSFDLGCNTGPDDIVITNGATEALVTALKATAKSGDIIAVESPTYFCILQLIENLGMLALEISTDPEKGMCIDALEKALKQVNIRAVVSVANFSNPLGSLMPVENKEKLVQLLTRHDIPLIEDDIFGDLYFDEQRPRIAKCFDSKGLVITCSSFSKTLAPGYRVGWVNPGRYRDVIIHSKRLLSSANATLPQLAIAEFLRTGHYDRHLKRLRCAYQEQVEKSRYHITRCFPEKTRITRPSGGFVLWIELPKNVDSETLYAESLAKGVSVTPGILFSPTTKFSNFIRISCGHPWSPEIGHAINTVGDLVHRLSEK